MLDTHPTELSTLSDGLQRPAHVLNRVRAHGVAHCATVVRDWSAADISTLTELLARFTDDADAYRRTLGEADWPRPPGAVARKDPP